MAPQPSPAAPRPIEVILSCTCCQRTIAEIYQYADGDKGFRHDSDNTTAQAVPKLWMTECAHLICSDHLDGGGVPFHPEGTIPKVACPHCSKYGDTKPKEVYYIRGLNKGQYDKTIPKEYFALPPVTFDGKSNGMNAMSFHYQQLIHFGTNILTKLYKARENAQEHEERAKAAEKKSQNAAHQIETLSKRVAELERCEIELKPWKEREAKITHYLNTFTKVIAENDKLREQMSTLGYAVPKRTWSVHEQSSTKPSSPPQAKQSRIIPRHPEVVEERLQPRPQPQPARPSEIQTNPQIQKSSPSSRTLSGPSEPVRNLHTIHNTVDQIHNPRKRHAEQEGDSGRQVKSPRFERPDSHRLMPPPPPPVAFRKPPALPSNFLEITGRLPEPNRNEIENVPQDGIGLPQVPEIRKQQGDRFLSQQNNREIDTRMDTQDVHGMNTSSNIYWNQRSSPSRRSPQFHQSESYEQQEGLIADPRKAQYQAQPQRQALSPRSPNVQTLSRDAENQNQFAQHMLPLQSPSYNNNNNYNQFQENLVYSDPGSVIMSDHHTQVQHFSDPSLKMPPPSTTRHANPRGKLNDVTSPFFSSQNRAATSRQRMTLPSRMKTGSSVPHYDINHLSFINKPHNPSNYQPITPGTGYTTSSYVPFKPAAQRHSNTSAFIQRPNANRNGLGNGSNTRSTVMTPFRPPTFQRPQQTQDFGQSHGNYGQQQQQQGYGGHQFMQPMTPRQSDQSRQYMHGTPMLMPSRMGTGMSGQGGGGGGRFGNFAYGAGFGR